MRATTVICWSTGWPRSNSDCRATPSSARPPSTCFRRSCAERIAADDERALQSLDGLFLDEHPWRSQVRWAARFITSKRIGIRDQTGEPRYIINVVEDVTERRRADEKIAHLAHYDALTDLPNRVLFRDQIERELLQSPPGRAVRPALYRHRRIQGHQRFARTSCRRRAVEDRGDPHQGLPQGRPT